MAFHVGQKVVCVDAKSKIGRRTPLVRGATYTVRWSGLFANHWTNGVSVPCVRVAEITRPCLDDITNEDTPFGSCRFRPVIERKTDISIFTEMLTPKNSRVTERA